MSDDDHPDIVIDLPEDDDSDSDSDDFLPAVRSAGADLAKVEESQLYTDPDCGHVRKGAGWWNCDYCGKKFCCCICPDDEQLAVNIEEAKADLQRMAAEARSELVKVQEEGVATTGTDLVTTDAPMDIKIRMVEVQKKTRRMRLAMQEKSKEIASMQKQQLERMEAEMNLVLKPMQKMVARMQEGIESINLYLGTREQIIMLQEGSPCPADEVVIVRQRVLAMDEETMIGASSGGLSYNDVDKFDEWLLADPAHLEQVIPERKAVVALIARRKDRKTGQRSYEEDDRNHWTYFLIRNGENLYRIKIDDFRAGATIIPTVDEFTSYFSRTDYRTKQRVELTPGSREWEEAEEKADARQRHFMRIGLVLQGLVDRTGVLRPIPDAGLSFLQPTDYLEGRIKAVTDAERVLTEGYETFREWQHRLLGEMRPGMRIVGAFDSVSWRDENYSGKRGEMDEDFVPRKSPKSASDPISGVPYMIEAMTRDGGLKFKYDRTDKVRRKVLTRSKWETHPDTYDTEKNPTGIKYHYKYDAYDYVYEDPKTRASCTVYPHDSFIIPFDLATVEEMERFLTLRGDRESYVTMLPLITAAIKVKQDEAAAEAPMRQLMVGALATENEVSVEDAEDVVDDLILWYKYTNKIHRSLAQDETKAVKLMVTEHARRLKAKKADDKVVETILEVHRDALLVARKRDGGYVVFTPQNADKVFVAIHDFGVRKGFSKTEEWQTVNFKSVATWDIAYTSPAWDQWDRKATTADHFTDPELDEAYERIVGQHKAKGRTVIAVSRHSYVSEKKRRTTIEVYTRGSGKRKRGAFEVDLDRPITGTWNEEYLEEWDHKLYRDKDGSVSDKLPWSAPSSVTSTRAHWNSFMNSGPEPTTKPRVWGDSENRVQLFEDTKALARFEADKAEYHEASKVRNRYTNRAQAAMNSLSECWRERRWEEKRAKFIEEYMDVELWEDHKKSVRIPDYPNQRYAHQSYNQWDNAIRRAVELDIDLNGKTVAEFIELAVAHDDLTLTEEHTPPESTHDLVFKYDITEPAEDDE